MLRTLQKLSQQMVELFANLSRRMTYDSTAVDTFLQLKSAPCEGDGKEFPMTVCPFCGLATELPHETQAACIEALQEEISHVREIVERMKDAARPARPKQRGSTNSPPPKHQTNH